MFLVLVKFVLIILHDVKYLSNNLLKNCRLDIYIKWFLIFWIIFNLAYLLKFSYLPLLYKKIELDCFIKRIAKIC